MSGAAEHVILTALIHAAERLWRIRFWRFKVIRPNAELRISFSALLRISSGGRYVLIRNLHRPEIFAPIGGVYKFYAGARTYLDSILFRPEDVGPLYDMRNDLRGFVPRKYLARIIKWFYAHEERESSGECILRELNEEINEINASLSIPPHLQLRKIRVVEEGPDKVPGRNYLQFRIFEVYEVEATNAHCFKLLEDLIHLSEAHKDLLLADSSDLVAGRCSDGRVIGHHTAYLVSKKRIRPDVAPLSAS